jgi:hypothetical protein
MNSKVLFNAASFCFVLFGYSFVAVFVTEAKQSQALTIPYRAAVLLISLYFLHTRFFQKVGDPIENFLNSKTYFKSRELVRIFPLITIFCIMYLFRFLNDIHGENLALGKPDYYFSFLFLISWIPCIVFLMIDMKRYREYLYGIQLSLFSFAIIMLFRLSALKKSVFYVQQGRLSSEALNPILLGGTSGALIIISVYILLQSKNNLDNQFIKILPYPSIPLGLYFLLSAASRGPIVSTIVCLTILLISSGRKILYVGFPAIMAGFFVVVEYVLPILQGDGVVKLDRVLSVGDASSDERRDFIGMSIKLILENWNNTLFGYGVELPKYGYPHNIILESFLSTGVIGGCLFTLICIVVLFRAIDLVLSKDPWGWVGILYVQILILSLLSGSLYASSPFWYLLFAVNNLWNKKDYVNVYRRIQQQYFQLS